MVGMLQAGQLKKESGVTRKESGVSNLSVEEFNPFIYPPVV